jgi:hypothetical protein
MLEELYQIWWAADQVNEQAEQFHSRKKLITLTGCGELHDRPNHLGHYHFYFMERNINASYLCQR